MADGDSIFSDCANAMQCNAMQRNATQCSVFRLTFIGSPWARLFDSVFHRIPRCLARRRTKEGTGRRTAEIRCVWLGPLCCGLALGALCVCVLRSVCSAPRTATQRLRRRRGIPRRNVEGKKGAREKSRVFAAASRGAGNVHRFFLYTPSS